ncbi:MAG: hypothetical protein U5L96_15210 [Owenweeksia sp.]|nr:hypothetical protein [Owenweeksia sp.]
MRPIIIFWGDTVGEYYCPFNGVSTPQDIKAAQEEAVSYAAYRLLKHRFQNSPGASVSQAYFDSLFTHLGFDATITSQAYTTGGPAELGNYIAQELIAFGYQDSSNRAKCLRQYLLQPV